MMREERAMDVINNIRHGAFAHSEASIRAALEGQVVFTSYLNSKTYRILKAHFDKHPGSTLFLREEGRNVTYAQHYKNRYGIDIIRLTNQPLLESRPSRHGLPNSGLPNSGIEQHDRPI